MLSCDCFYFFWSQFKLGGNYDSHFDVDKGTGTIIVAKPLDAEQKSNYNLTVEATDGTTIILTQVSELLVMRLSEEDGDNILTWGGPQEIWAVDSALWGSKIRRVCVLV